jgi:hypothetical protein
MLSVRGRTQIRKNIVFSPVQPHENVEASKRKIKMPKTLNSDGFPPELNW